MHVRAKQRQQQQYCSGSMWTGHHLVPLVLMEPPAARAQMERLQAI